MTDVIKKTNQDEVNQTLPPSTPPKKTEEPLSEFLVTQQQLARMQNDLNTMFNATASNPSMFSRASIYWATLPLWQKITVGVILIAPTLIVGIAASITGLVWASLFTLVTYTISSMILTDHQTQNTMNTEQLRSTVSNLVALLTTVITSLDTLREQLATELHKFQKENEQLAQQVSHLSEQVEELTNQVTLLQATEYKLRLTQEELEKTSSSLQNSIQEQSKLLQKSEEELKRAKEQYESVHNELSKKIAELNDVIIQMRVEVDEAKGVSITLRRAVALFSKRVIADENQRIAFHQRLDDFLNDKEKRFDQIVDELDDVKQNLAQRAEEYRRCNQRYQEFLDQQEHQMNRLAQTDNEPAVKTPGQQMSPANVMKNWGLYACNEPNTEHCTEQPTAQKTLK